MQNKAITQNNMKNLEIGAVYKHYKGTRVKVLFEAIESETKEHYKA